MIFESHAHYDDAKFDDDRELLLQRLLSDSICGIINVGASIKSTKASIALAEKHSAVYAAAGVHPEMADELDEDSFAWLKEQLRHPKVVAVGEIGLDYYHGKEQTVRERQKHWFARQLELAKVSGLPVIIHSRDAAQDTLRIMKDTHADEISGVVHCFSYAVNLAEEFVAMGYFIGVGGVVTFKNGKKLVETVKKIPLEKILLETDAPYLSPEPFRGSRNDSSNLVYVAERIAQIKGITADEVIEVTKRNGERLFHIN
ncbi:MAG: TatD family hydrolase [Eubacterium sp.]|jgi:TatD DNase family protein|nr:TatD family hydrolase [Eubacterium sp.]